MDGRYGSVLLNLPAYAACHWIGGLERAEATVIWTNIAFGSAAVGTLALLLMELLRSRAASLLGAALFSVSPIYLSITTYGKPHGIEAFLVLTSLWLVLRSARTGSTTEAALGSVALGAAILTRESTLIDLPIFALAALRPRLSLRPLKLHVGGPARRPARLLAASLPAVLIVGVAWPLYLQDVVLRNLYRPGVASATWFGFLSPVLTLSLPDVWTGLTPLGIGLACAGAVAMAFRDDDRFPFLFLLAWTALFFYFGNTNSYSPRYLSLVSVPAYAFMGVALAWLVERTPWLGVALSVGLAGWLFATIEPIIAYRHQRSGPKDYALWLRGRVPPEAAIVVMDDHPFVEYYAGLETLSHPIGDPDGIAAWMADVRRRLERGQPVYVVESGFDYDPGGRFRHSVFEHFRVVPVGAELTENYHRSELVLRIYAGRLFRLEERHEARGHGS